MFNPLLKSKPNEDICILIKVDNHPYHYVCDAGEASLLSVKECQNTQAIFFSHTHIDHIVNFDTFLRHQLGIQKTVIICGPEHITEQIQNRIRSYSWNLINEDAVAYEVREITKDGGIKRTLLKPPLWKQEPLDAIPVDVIFENNLFKVGYTILDHKLDSVAYLFKAHDKIKIDLSESGFKPGSWVGELKKAFELDKTDQEIKIEGKTFQAKELFYLMKMEEGKSLGVIMDHAASEENHQKIVNTFKYADQVFIECFYKIAEKDFATANHHSYSKKSGEVMRLANVKEAIPVHFSRKYDELDIVELVEEFYQAYVEK